MNASSAVGTWGRRVAVACLAAGLATVATAPAGAHGPGPIAENPAWKQYVLGTGRPDATPIRVTSTSGAVTNAQGLIHRSKKPTTLTYTTGRPAPTIVLDYGREVGGLPFFDVGRVAPADGATSVSLRAAYSETLQFLWSYGNSTLSVAAAAGDTNLKVGSVANFVVGGTAQGRRRDRHDRGGRDAIAQHDLVRRRRGGRHEHQGGVHHRDRCRRHHADRHRRHDGVGDRDERRHAGPGDGHHLHARAHLVPRRGRGGARPRHGRDAHRTTRVRARGRRPGDRNHPGADGRPQRLQRGRASTRVAPTPSRSPPRAPSPTRPTRSRAASASRRSPSRRRARWS